MEHDQPIGTNRHRSPAGSPAARPWLIRIATLIAAAFSSVAAAQVITEFPIPTANSAPFGITTGPDGNIWFTEKDANKIGRITPAGVVTGEFSVPTAASEPRWITTGPDGNLWFTEQAGNKIGRITPTGSITEFSVPTAASKPGGIAAGPDGNLWFTEINADNVGRITTAGVITEFPIPTSASAPHDINPGPDGKLWFAERDADQIGNVTTTGSFTEFPIPSVNSLPGSIAAGPDGNLWFNEEGVNKIGRITTSGVVTEFAASGGPFTITAGPDGNLWFTEEGGNRIGQITTAGVVTEFALPLGNNLPRGITSGPDGNLWFVERGTNKIGRITTGPLFDLGLTVDAGGNGVFEPGETVTVAPTWKNNGGSSISRTGAASAFTGPAGPTYTRVDSTADYGTIAVGASANCETATADCYSLEVTAASRPAFHWDTTLLETMSDGTEKTWTLHIGDSFSDVSRPSNFYRFIETIFHEGVTAGCGGTNFCPTSNVTRQQMAVFLLVSRFGSSYAPSACSVPIFNDVPCSSGFARWVNDLANRGVTAGCGNGNFCPTDPVTRAQMAVFLLRTKEGPSYTPPACTSPTFADVPCSSNFAPWINELANRGITAGCGGSNYCPDAANTRGQMAVFLTTTFGLQLYGK